MHPDESWWWWWWLFLTLAILLQKICPSGEFDRKSFVEFFSELRPDKDGELLCKQMFNAFDQDNSGRVDFNEFLIAISLTSDKFKDDPRKKLEFAFNMYDSNRDQKLSLKEIEEIVAGIYQFTGQNESSADVKKPSEVAKYMLAKYDKDKNGFITKDEFLNGIIVDPTLQALKSFSILRTGDFGKI